MALWPSERLASRSSAPSEFRRLMDGHKVAPKHVYIWYSGISRGVVKSNRHLKAPFYILLPWLKHDLKLDVWGCVP